MEKLVKLSLFSNLLVKKNKKFWVFFFWDENTKNCQNFYEISILLIFYAYF